MYIYIYWFFFALWRMFAGYVYMYIYIHTYVNVYRRYIYIYISVPWMTGCHRMSQDATGSLPSSPAFLKRLSHFQQCLISQQLATTHGRSTCYTQIKICSCSCTEDYQCALWIQKLPEQVDQTSNILLSKILGNVFLCWHRESWHMHPHHFLFLTPVCLNSFRKVADWMVHPPFFPVQNGHNWVKSWQVIPHKSTILMPCYTTREGPSTTQHPKRSMEEAGSAPLALLTAYQSMMLWVNFDLPGRHHKCWEWDLRDHLTITFFRKVT